MKSPLVISSQTDIHSSLSEIVIKHCDTVWRQPIRRHTQQAFDQFMQIFQESDFDQLILDAGCGTGHSSLQLATQFPRHLVLGIDQSPQRLGRGLLSVEQKQCLSKQPVSLGNCMLLRAELADFWRLLSLSKVRPEKITLFYPNPWPKPSHFNRRWHGHPVFPTLLGLGAAIELRSNWKIYLQEFALAVGIVTGEQVQLEQLRPEDYSSAYCSPFEKKYFESGHCLWRLQTRGFNS